jgi:hypothetical protein
MIALVIWIVKLTGWELLGGLMCRKTSERSFGITWSMPCLFRLALCYELQTICNWEGSVLILEVTAKILSWQLIYLVRNVSLMVIMLMIY